MTELMNKILNALNDIKQNYFKIDIASDDCNSEKIKRERVFCYELYHQMRKAKIISKDIDLFGEVDKRGHPLFTKEDQKNPDFILHKAGTMKNNIFVMEVKGEIDNGGIIKDFETIKLFKEKYEYKYGAFILFNYNIDQFIGRMKEELLKNNIIDDSPESTYIICGESEGKFEVKTLKEIIY